MLSEADKDLVLQKNYLALRFGSLKQLELEQQQQEQA